MTTTLRTTLALAVLATLAACGGGGGGDSGPAPDTTRPTVVSFDPAEAATGVARTASMVVTFSEALNPASVTSATVTLTGPSGAVSTSRVLSGGNRIVTLTPSLTLENYAVHVLQVGTGVKDSAGNALAATAAATFRTADTVPPAEPSSPLGPAYVSLAAPSPTFSWTATSDVGTGIASHDYELALDTSGELASFVTTGSVAMPAREVTLGGLGAHDGATLYFRAIARDAVENASLPSVWSAGTKVDLTRPAVASFEPADGTTAVSRTAAVVVTFTEPVDPATVTSATVTLAGPGGPVSASVALSALNTVATLTPVAPLANHALHTVSVSALVTDVAGNGSGAPAAISFRTLDSVPPPAPAAPVRSVALANLAAPDVSFTWEEPVDDGAGIASYEWVASVNTTGLPPFVWGPSAQAGTTGAVPPSAVWDGQTLYARVRARDASGNQGDWSGWSSGVRLDYAGPTAAFSPPSGATDVPRSGPFTVTFGEAVDAATITSVSVALESASPTPVTVPSSRVLAGRVLTVTPLAPLAPWGAYRLRVTPAVTDPAGNPLGGTLDLRAGGPSDASYRTADDVAPVMAAAVLDAGDHDDASVTFSWGAGATDAGAGLAGYEVRLAASVPGNFVGDPVFVTSTGWTFDAAALALLDGTAVFADVRPIDLANNAGAAALSDGVLLDLAAPTLPGVPVDAGDGSLSAALHFDWAASFDAGSGLAGYTCEIAEGAGRTFVAYVDAGPTPTTPGCDYTARLNERIFVRVQARDLLGQETAFTDWSDGILVTTSVPATPGRPDAPARYQTSAAIPFAWAPPPGGLQAGDTYTLQIGTTVGGNDVAEVTGLASDFHVFLGGAHGVTYYARAAVRSSASGFTGAFSGSSGPVTIDTTPPDAPTGVARAGGTPGGFVTFGWSAVDPESGITSHELELTVGGSLAGTFTAAAPTFTAGPFPTGAVISARVRATNGALLTSAWSAPSADVAVDSTPPWAWSQTPGGRQPTNLDLVVRFSEPMDRLSVEAAFSLRWGAGLTPAHGYVFHWSDGDTRLTVVPDTQAPAGETNVDLLPESTDLVMAIATTATDVAGNPLQAPLSSSFSTGDETAPALATLVEKRSGGSSPFDPAFTQSVTLLLGFDEDMSPSGASVLVESPTGRAEGGMGSRRIAGATVLAGKVVFTLDACNPDEVRVGELVSVRDANPAEWNVSRATVDAVAGCTVTVSAATLPAAPWSGGGWMATPTRGPGQPRLQWIAARTLQVELPQRFSLPPGSDATLELWNVADLAWNGAWARTTLQVRRPGDAVRPQLVSTVPAQGATGVRAGVVALRFSEPIDAATVAGITASCDGCARGLYAAEYDSRDMGPLVLLFPSASPPGGALVTVHVPDTVADVAGNRLAAAVDLSFTVEDVLEDGAPQIRETTPPSGVPVDGFWSIEVAFEDELDAVLEAIDPRTVGAHDVRVTDLGTGLLVRGFRTEASAGSAVVRLRPPPWSRLGAEQAQVGVTHAVGAGGVVTYTTEQPHGMAAPGGRVWVSLNRDDPRFPDPFDVDGATVTAITGPSAFQVASVAVGEKGDGSGRIGEAGVPRPRSYVVELAGVPGADGIADARGNGMDAATSFQLDVQPWPERAPAISDLRDLRLEVTTSGAGIALRASARVRDPDLGTLGVSIRNDAGRTLTGTAQTVTLGAWSDASYSYPSGGGGGGGPPSGFDPPELGEGYTSGYYGFELALDDGAFSTSYLRELWIWATTDVPRVTGIDDGGTFRSVGARPIVVESASPPSFGWAGMDAANADLAGLYVLSLEAAGDSDPPAGFRTAMTFAPSATGSIPTATALEPDLYLWAVFQQKLAPGSYDPGSSAWSIELSPSGITQAMFAVGPNNRDLAGRTFAGARFGLDAGASSPFSRVGTFAFEGASPGAAPVSLVESFRDETGAQLLDVPALFAYGAGKRFTVAPFLTPSPLPLPMHGAVGLGGAFFVAAQEDPSLPSLEAAAHRFQTSGFGGALDGRFAFVQASRSGSADASVGWAEFDAGGLATVHGTLMDRTTFSFPLPYTLGDDGAVRLQLDAGKWAEGLVGGAPGAEIAVLAVTNGDPGSYFWLLMAREYAWLGTEGVALLSGTYRFADLASMDASSGTGSSGTMTLDGNGNATFEGTAMGTRFSGFGTYAVDPVARQVTFTRLDGGPGPANYTFALGPNADVLLGVATETGSTMAEVLVLAR